MSTAPDLQSARSGIVRKSQSDEDLAAVLSAAKREENDLRKQAQADNHARGMAQLNQGRVGGALGSGADKSGNIAFIVILICFIMIILLCFKLDISKDFENFMKFCGPIFSIITGALGYLFGSKKEE